MSSHCAAPWAGLQTENSQIFWESFQLSQEHPSTRLRNWRNVFLILSGCPDLAGGFFSCSCLCRDESSLQPPPLSQTPACSCPRTECPRGPKQSHKGGAARAKPSPCLWEPEVYRGKSNTNNWRGFYSPSGQSGICRRVGAGRTHFLNRKLGDDV